MSMTPVRDADGKVIGYEWEAPPPTPVGAPEWKPWKGGDYDDSDGKFVSCLSHVIKDSDGRIGCAYGPGWAYFVVAYRLYDPTTDKDLPQL